MPESTTARIFLEQMKIDFMACTTMDYIIKDSTYKNEFFAENIKQMQKKKAEKIAEANKRKDFILSLDTEYRIKQALILRYVYFKSRKEIARFLNYSVSYIDTLLKKGLSAVEDALKQSKEQ